MIFLTLVSNAHSNAILVLPHPAGPLNTPTDISSSARSTAAIVWSLFRSLLAVFFQNHQDSFE